MIVDTVFSDITPIPTEVVPDGICTVRFPPHFESLLGYLRACIKSGEISKRVHDLTEEVITTNTSFISAWVIRQRCIVELNLDLEGEWKFLDTIRGFNEKCYQTWMHRMFLIGLTGVVDKEKAYCDSYISMDNKNIHSWSHRMWVVSNYDQYEGEIDYTTTYIEIDIFNNSAWSHRFYIYTHLHDTVEGLAEEIDFVMTKILIAPHNEASWNYLQGLVKEYPEYNCQDLVYEIKRILEQDPTIVPANSFLVRYALNCFELESIDEAFVYCKTLQMVDVTRREYWNHMERKLNANKQYLLEM